jgi:autotransporter-associated beta strand protein
MKPKSTLRSFLALAGSSLLAVTCASAETYYWDGNDGTVGFQNAHPGPAGTWTNAGGLGTPSTATGGFTTDSTGSTAISTNPNVVTTTADTVFIGTNDRNDVQGPSLFAFTGPITIDGTVDVGYLRVADGDSSWAYANTPTINFAAEGTFESNEVNLLSFPAVSLTGAGTSMTWKVGYSDNLTLHSFDGVTLINGAAKNILTGPGRISVNGKEDLGPDGTPLVLDGGALRMIAGIAWNNYDDINTDHPLTLTPGKKLAVENRKGSAFTVSYTPDPTFAVVGAGGFESEGTSEVILNQNYAWTGPLVLTSGICSVESSANIGTGNDLVFNNGTLKIRGTTLTNFSTIGHTVVFTIDKGVALNIDDAGHTFTVDQALNQGTGAFTKTGAGTVILDQASSTYTGATNVSAGTLNLSNIPAVVSGLTTVSGTGTLNLSGDNSAATCAVTMNGATATLNLASASALGTGTCTLQAGTLKNSVTTLSTTHPVNFAGNFTWDGVNNLTFGNGAITMAAGRTITLNGTDSILTFGGVLTNTQAGNPTLTVNGAGNSLVISGGLALSGPTDASNRTVTISGTGNVTINGPVSAGGNGTSTASLLTKSGTGTLTLEGDNTYDGNTTVNTGGELSLVGGSQASAITVNSGAFLGLTVGETTTSTAALNLQTGHKVRIHGTPVAPNSYTLCSAASLGGTALGVPDIETPITDYELVKDGNDIKLNYVPSSTPYQTWATGNEPFDGDANGDGVKDGLAFLLGAATPATDATGLLPTTSQTGGNLVMSFTCLATADRGTATLNLEYDGDLAGTWLSVPVPGAVGAPNPIVENTTTGSVSFVATDGGTNTNGDALIDVEATISDATESASGKLFGRLKAEEN